MNSGNSTARENATGDVIRFRVQPELKAALYSEARRLKVSVTELARISIAERLARQPARPNATSEASRVGSK